MLLHHCDHHGHRGDNFHCPHLDSDLKSVFLLLLLLFLLLLLLLLLLLMVL